MPETLFIDVECPLAPKRFLWWKWQERTHDYIIESQWSTPGFYSTLFYTKRFCVKCWTTDVQCIEESGP